MVSVPVVHKSHYHETPSARLSLPSSSGIAGRNLLSQRKYINVEVQFELPVLVDAKVLILSPHVGPMEMFSGL